MTATIPLIDDLLPGHDVESCHSIGIAAPSDIVYAKARELDLSGSWLIRFLFALRGLPTSALNVEGLTRRRFKILVEEPNRAFVMGIIGRFWTPSGELVDFDPSGFKDFATPGHAKATWSFDLTTTGGDRTSLRTVTRVRCTDASSRRKFRIYWSFVGPFSGLIRSSGLKLVRDASEAYARGAHHGGRG